MRVAIHRLSHTSAPPVVQGKRATGGWFLLLAMDDTTRGFAGSGQLRGLDGFLGTCGCSNRPPLPNPLLPT